jgi:hypothetical protein
VRALVQGFDVALPIREVFFQPTAVIFQPASAILRVRNGVDPARDETWGFPRCPRRSGGKCDFCQARPEGVAVRRAPKPEPTRGDC